MAPDLRSRYQAAERLLSHRWKELVLSGQITPRWIEGGDQFWYANTTREGKEFVLVDPKVRTRAPAFDHEKVADALADVLGRRVEPSKLPVRSLEFRNHELRLHVEGRTWIWDPPTASLTAAPEPAPATTEAVSPDGRWAVVVRDHNLVVRERATGAERPLTRDGAEGYSYGTQPDITSQRILLERVGREGLPPLVAWSPDSRRLVTHRIDERSLPFMHYVQSTPPDGGRPRLHGQRYAAVGEAEVPKAELCVIEVETGRRTWFDAEPIPTKSMSPIWLRHIWWDKAGRRLYLIWGERGDRVVRLCAIDPDTGAVRVVIEETSATQVQHHPFGYGAPNVRVLATGETVWWSERTGWGHLYLYGADGSVRALTHGDWLVRDLIAVDEEARVVLFAGAGREEGFDPYVRQLYRVDLDEGIVERLTDDTLDHYAVASPSGRYLVDVKAYVDTPASSALLDAGGETVLELERADAGLLYEAGWTPPERFRVKAADGTTDLYGLLYKPPGFDPTERYPVLDDIYPGPQVNWAHVRFPRSGGSSVAHIVHAPSMAALGFVVVIVDARGTPLRNQAFRDHCRGSCDADFVDDHVAAIRELAADRPWMDTDRAGICGASGGGRASTAAMLHRPDFFKVAVSASGNHDDFMYRASWGEKFVGLADDGAYPAHANAAHAERLQGKLLLIHGEMDDNVTPYLTLRLVDALIAANKDFDLLVVPNGDHSIWLYDAYTIRRGWDYLVRNLHGEEPPAYRIADIPLDLEMLGLGG